MLKTKKKNKEKVITGGGDLNLMSDIRIFYMHTDEDLLLKVKMLRIIDWANPL